MGEPLKNSQLTDQMIQTQQGGLNIGSSSLSPIIPTGLHWTGNECKDVQEFKSK